jgi:hypothetical protein
MSYDECIAAAGTPVLAYLEVGDYQGNWYAKTAAGYYSGYFGSCSGCDWQQEAQSGVDSWDSEKLALEINAGIGREILKVAAKTLEELLAWVSEWSDDRDKVAAWAATPSPEEQGK